MNIKKADNLYRSIGGRSNPGGVERINRDGKMEVLPMGGEEVTPKERMDWNAKCTKDPRGRLPEEIFKVEKDEAGNPMAVNDVERTRLPRPHQYSTESRLVVQRGGKVGFPKSTATSAQAHGVTDGMVADNTFVDPAKKDGHYEKREKEKKFHASETKPKMTKNSMDYRLADTFKKIAESLETRDFLDEESVAQISKISGVSVEEVLMLEKIAQTNVDLASRYKSIQKDPKQHPHEEKNRKVRKIVLKQEQKDIPGVESEPEEPDLKKIGDEVGLND